MSEPVKKPKKSKPEVVPYAERDTRPFYQRENLTRSEWLEVARVINPANIPHSEVRSVLVAKSLLSSATKDEKIKLGRSASIFADLLLADSSENVIESIMPYTSEAALVSLFTTETCVHTGKALTNIREYRYAVDEIDFSRISGNTKALYFLYKKRFGKSSYYNFKADTCGDGTLSPDLAINLLQSGASSNADMWGILRDLRETSKEVDMAIGSWIGENNSDSAQYGLACVVTLVGRGVMGDANIARILREVARINNSRAGYPLIIRLLGMIKDDKVREDLFSVLTVMGPQTAYQNTWDASAYSILSLANGEFERIFRATVGKNGRELLCGYHTLRTALVRYVVDGGAAGDVVPVSNYGDAVDFISNRITPEAAAKAGMSSVFYGLATPDERASFAKAAVAIASSEEWGALVRSVEKVVLDLAENVKESKSQFTSGSMYSLALSIIDQLVYERFTDGDSLLAAKSVLVARSGGASLFISTPVTRGDSINYVFSLMGPEYETQRSHVVAMEFKPERGSGEPPISLLQTMTSQEIIKLVRLGARISRLKGDLETKFAAGLSVEEFWQLLVDDNVRIQALGYQIAHHFISKRQDMAGNTASVKDFVRIMVSGGAVGDKELNSHIAKLCDYGADLTAVALAAAMYKRLDMGVDTGVYTDEALLAIAPEIRGISDFTSYGQRKAMVQRAKADKAFMTALKGVNARLANEINAIPATASYSESAEFIKNIIFNKRSEIIEYQKIDPSIIDYYAKYILSLLPRSKWANFFFGSLSSEYIVDAVRGVRDLRGDTAPDIHGRVLTAEDRREFLLSSLAEALQSGRIAQTPKAIHDEIAMLNRKLSTPNIALYDLINPHPAYHSTLASGVDFEGVVKEETRNLVAKIISTSHDKLEWGDELVFCVGNDSYTQRARTGRYFYIGVYLLSKDAKPAKYGVVEICANSSEDGAAGGFHVGQAKLKFNDSMPVNIYQKVLAIFSSIAEGEPKEPAALTASR